VARRVFLVVVLGAAAAAATGLVYAAISAQSGPSPDAPRALELPLLVRAGSDNEEIGIDPFELTWRSPVRGVPVRLRYSWLECDLAGNSCSSLPGLTRKTIAPPQEQRIVTLRGVVTGINRYGSRSVVSRNFYYDMAGLAFDVKSLDFVHNHLQYDPDQLRRWYGLSTGQDGAGQTIAVTDYGREGGLRAAVDRFSGHYGLPQACGRASLRKDCFPLVISYVGRRPTDSVRGGPVEAAADVEWVHAIAPKAKIVFVQFDYPDTLFAHAALLASGHASVVSDSWGAPSGVGVGYARHLVYPSIADGCGVPHLVCVQASGDRGSPGSTPSNSPYLLAVGGTMFLPSRDGTAESEIPWRFTGEGDTRFPLRRPAWQKLIRERCRHAGGAHSCANRAVPDVSATAALVPVFVSPRYGWVPFEGTSLSTPLWAALIALADQQLQADGEQPIGIDELHQVLYHGDVNSGLDDLGPPGWDWSTGLGSPKSGIVTALAGAIERYRAQR
jgi:subtilase family serine protease